MSADKVHSNLLVRQATPKELAGIGLGVSSPGAGWMLGSVTLAFVPAPTLAKKGASPPAESVRVWGRIRYERGFNVVWVGGELFDLRERHKARLGLEYLVQKKAFDAKSARHFDEEIDRYVRTQDKLGPRGRFSDIKIDHYFNDSRNHLIKLRQALIRVVAGEKKYFLEVASGPPVRFDRV